MIATPTIRTELRCLLAEDGYEVKGDKLRCLNPAHEDKHPSEHIFDDDRGGHLYCFACGHHLDAVQYLVEHRGASMRQALEHLGLSEATGPRPKIPAKPTMRARQPEGCGSKRDLKSLPDSYLNRFLSKIERTYRIPPALIGRGFQDEDIGDLCIAEGEDGAGLFAIFGPNGELLNVKRRYAGKNVNPRYDYLVAGNGSPAWCSPGILTHDEVLVVEGELNAMAAWLACPEVGVMGPAGSGGCLHLDALKGRTVYIYADDDKAGDKARERWVRQAREAGARHILVLEAWPDGDACDVAGRLSRAALRKRLTT